MSIPSGNAGRLARHATGACRPLVRLADHDAGARHRLAVGLLLGHRVTPARRRRWPRSPSSGRPRRSSPSAAARGCAMRRRRGWSTPLAALALVLASGDWRSPFYIFALTTLVLPATALPWRAALSLAASAFSAGLRRRRAADPPGALRHAGQHDPAGDAGHAPVRAGARRARARLRRRAAGAPAHGAGRVRAARPAGRAPAHRLGAARLGQAARARRAPDAQRARRPADRRRPRRASATRCASCAPRRPTWRPASPSCAPRSTAGPVDELLRERARELAPDRQRPRSTSSARCRRCRRCWPPTPTASPPRR